MLVIFDCDGVLVDSEQIANEVMRQHLSRLGLQVPLQTINDAFRGLSMSSVLDKIQIEFGVALPDDFLERLQADTFTRFEESLQPIAGVESALRQFKERQIPICVASSGSYDKLALTLGITGLADFFEGCIYSAVDVPRGKPAPDLFLYAAKQMGVSEVDTIVVEDSVAGIQAAKAAGMQVFAYCEPSLQAEDIDERLALGAQCIYSMANLPRYLDLAARQ